MFCWLLPLLRNIDAATFEIIISSNSNIIKKPISVTIGGTTTQINFIAQCIMKELCVMFFLRKNVPLTNRGFTVGK